MAGVKLSKQGYEILEVVMTELEMERPEVLRLAFAKGLTESEAVQEVKREYSDFEFPISVIAKGDESLLVKHLIIDKVRTQIDEKKLDRLILSCVEQGLEIMNQEIKQLSSADNYLLYLIQKHTV